jgi:hypothetical protein
VLAATCATAPEREQQQAEQRIAQRLPSRHAVERAQQPGQERVFEDEAPAA